MNEQPKWVPNRSVGPYVFGDPIEPLVKLGNAVARESEMDETHWASFDAMDYEGMRIDCENGVIENISCYRSLFHKRQQILQASIDSLEALFERKIELDEEPILIDDREQRTASLDDLGIQFWFLDNKCVSVDCTIYPTEE